MRIGFDVGSVPAGRCSGRCVTSGRADEPSAQSVIEEEVVDDAGKHRQKRQDENGHQSNHPGTINQDRQDRRDRPPKTSPPSSFHFNQSVPICCDSSVHTLHHSNHSTYRKSGSSGSSGSLGSPQGFIVISPPSDAISIRILIDSLIIVNNS